jgi:hypothetical protein
MAGEGGESDKRKIVTIAMSVMPGFVGVGETVHILLGLIRITFRMLQIQAQYRAFEVVISLYS